MYFLIFIDWLTGSWTIIAALLIAIVGILLICIRIPPQGTRIALRSLGVLLCIPVALFCVGWTLFSGFNHTKTSIYSSPSGKRTALLSHTEDRDSAGSKITVKIGCCRVATAYEYSGYGSDYIDFSEDKPVQWLDDRHLVIRYALDDSDLPLRQHCLPEIADTKIICQPHKAPALPTVSPKL